MYDRQALIDLVKAKALEFGDFTLASGKKRTSIWIAAASRSTLEALT